MTEWVSTIFCEGHHAYREEWVYLPIDREIDRSGRYGATAGENPAEVTARLTRSLGSTRRGGKTFREEVLSWLPIHQVSAKSIIVAKPI